PRRGAFSQSAVVDQAHASEGARQLRCLRICGVEAVLERPLHRDLGHAHILPQGFVGPTRKEKGVSSPRLKPGVSTPNNPMNENRHPFTPVGAHVPVAGGMATKGLAYADTIGAETIQVFTSNPRGWATKEGDPRQDARMCEAELPVFVHSPYLINLGTPNEETAGKSAHSLRHTMRRGAGIGAGGVVVHTGSAVSGGREAGLARTRERLMPLLEELGEDVPPLLLEPMAGQGQVLCATVDDLVPYFEALDWHPNVGVCLESGRASRGG